MFCPDCGRFFTNCVADPACPNCGYNPTKIAMKTSKGSCTECGGSGLTAAGGLCPKCKDLLREDENDLGTVVRRFAAAAAKSPNPICPECGGTGEVTLFTSVRPCSMCGGK